MDSISTSYIIRGEWPVQESNYSLVWIQCCSHHSQSAQLEQTQYSPSVCVEQQTWGHFMTYISIHADWIVSRLISSLCHKSTVTRRRIRPRSSFHGCCLLHVWKWDVVSWFVGFKKDRWSYFQAYLDIILTCMYVTVRVTFMVTGCNHLQTGCEAFPSYCSFTVRNVRHNM